mmetsp:Transcript_32381/g.84941  ORF Transcript_32381/g.84941 Transcript_32381/m.84941 type:complete len:503 (-) Transcript_32381:290-1798(-)
MTGVVRAAVENMWNDLKRGHYIDSMTRLVTITLQLKSNHVGVRYRITLMLELTSLGAILPSYDVETRILDERAINDMMLYATISLVMVVFFAVLEVLELVRLGPLDYVQDLWSIMDWVNYLLFFIVWSQVCSVHAAILEEDCSSFLCSKLGYFDDWKVMDEYRRTKQYLALCVCLQLFKITKFTAALIPKMGLMSNVLRQAAVDILFFGVVFFNSLIAFSCMLYVQLGPVMEDFYDQIPAIVSLFRALFGDFDIDEIMNNSAGYLNAILFLGYLFVAIFIMLSLFLAILAEAQAAVREKEHQQKLDHPDYNEFGVVHTCWDYAQAAIAKARRRVVDSGDGIAGNDGSDEDTDAITTDVMVRSMRSEICAIKDIIHTLVADMHSLRRNVPALHRSDTATSLQFNSDLSGYGGRSRTDSLLTETQGASFCHEGSAAMLEHDASHLRQVVESLDANLSLKLAQINRRLTMGGSSGVRKSRPGKLEDDLSAHADHNHLKFLSGQMS